MAGKIRKEAVVNPKEKVRLGQIRSKKEKNSKIRKLKRVRQRNRRLNQEG